jgi:hypothetical protein
MSATSDGGPAFPGLTRNSNEVYSMHEAMLMLPPQGCYSPRESVVVLYALPIWPNEIQRQATRENGSFTRGIERHDSARNEVPCLPEKNELEVEGWAGDHNYSSARQVWRDEDAMLILQHSARIIWRRCVLFSRSIQKKMPSMQGGLASRFIF